MNMSQPGFVQQIGPPLQSPPLQGPPMQGPPLQGPPLQESKKSKVLKVVLGIFIVVILLSICEVVRQYYYTYVGLVDRLNSKIADMDVCKEKIVDPTTSAEARSTRSTKFSDLETDAEDLVKNIEDGYKSEIESSFTIAKGNLVKLSKWYDAYKPPTVGSQQSAAANAAAANAQANKVTGDIPATIYTDDEKAADVAVATATETLANESKTAADEVKKNADANDPMNVVKYATRAREKATEAREEAKKLSSNAPAEIQAKVTKALAKVAAAIVLIDSSVAAQKATESNRRLDPFAFSQYLGLYKDATPRHLPKHHDEITSGDVHKLCALKALDTGHELWGIQYNTHCFSGPSTSKITQYSANKRAGPSNFTEAQLKGFRGSGWMTDIWRLDKTRPDTLVGPEFERNQPMTLSDAGHWEDTSNRAMTVVNVDSRGDRFNADEDGVQACFLAARNNGHKYVGIQDTNSCWGSNDESFKKYGSTSKQGRMVGKYRVGEGWTNWVYKLD